MKDAKYFTVGEKVHIEVEVTGVKVGKQGFVYNLKNPQTGRPFDFTFSEEQLFPIDGGTNDKD